MKFSLVLRFSVIVVLFSATSRPEPIYQYNYENVLGTSCEIKIQASSEEIADMARSKVLTEIDRLNSILSTYIPTSEISVWVKTYNTPEKISSELFEVLSLFEQWKEKTGGALNASAAVAIDLWKEGVKEHKLPDQVSLQEAVMTMAQPQWQLNKQNQTATHLSRTPLVLNTFVKSYIIKKASKIAMNVSGVRSAVINIGGDIVVSGDLREGVRVANPMDFADNGKSLSILRVSNKAIATSGNYFRGFKIADIWYSHIIDARTARPVDDVTSATVIADNPTDAGALATAFNILTATESEMLAEQIGAEYQIVKRNGDQIVSSGWKSLVEENSNQTPLTADVQTSYQAMINIELAQFQGRSHRPFVAVWVENKKKKLVRTIAVWFNKPRWLPDLKKWSSTNQAIAQNREALSSLSSATRSPGKYALVWDGLDDSGQAVANGRYTIYIEAAREHGTYQLIKQDVEWNGKPNHYDLEGGVEVNAASIDLKSSEK